MSAGLCFYFATFVAAAFSRNALFPVPWYAANALLLCTAAIVLITVAFLRARQRRRFTGALTCAATVALLVGAADAYILGFRFDTVGPGSELALTHIRWLETFVSKNEAGFWERPLSPYYNLSPDERFVVAAVGDSFTWGQGLTNVNSRASNRLQRRLRSELGRNDIDVLNYALGNGSTRTETAWIRNWVVKVRPDVVIVFYLANDVDEVSFFQSTRPTMTATTRALIIASPTLNYLYWNLLGPVLYAQMGNVYFRNILMAHMREELVQRHLDDIAAQIRAIREIGAVPMFTILPFPHLWYDINPEWKERIYATIIAQAERSGAAVLNLTGLEAELPPQEFQVNRIDGHPNARAHALIADHVYDWFVSHRELWERRGQTAASNR